MFILILSVLLFEAGTAQRLYYYNDPAIQRPCPDLNPNCIRNFFAQTTGCRPTYGIRNQRHYIDYLRLPLPHANISFAWVGAEVRGMENWQITEFYINRNTRNLVMEVSLNDVVTTCDNAQVKYYLKAREPVTLSGYLSFAYIKMMITAVIPYDPVKGILWSRMDSFAYHPVNKIIYEASPNLVNSDPEVRASYYELFRSPELALKEAWPTVPPYYFNLFFNNYLCKLQNVRA